MRPMATLSRTVTCSRFKIKCFFGSRVTFSMYWRKTLRHLKSNRSGRSMIEACNHCRMAKPVIIPTVIGQHGHGLKPKDRANPPECRPIPEAV